MARTEWDPEPEIETSPDRIDRDALRQVRLLDGERVRRVWKTGRGFLVMTNLRCVEVSHKPQLFAAREWEAGPNFFFYDLAPPRVVFHHYLRLAEQHDEARSLVMHFFVHDPYRVAEEVHEARAAGYNEWVHRRSQAEAAFRSSHTRAGAYDRQVFREMVKVRCEFCGNLMSVAARVCPSCGAPQR